jgi:hypothetical protein
MRGDRSKRQREQKAFRFHISKELFWVGVLLDTQGWLRRRALIKRFTLWVSRCQMRIFKPRQNSASKRIPKGDRDLFHQVSRSPSARVSWGFHTSHDPRCEDPKPISISHCRVLQYPHFTRKTHFNPITLTQRFKTCHILGNKPGKLATSHQQQTKHRLLHQTHRTAKSFQISPLPHHNQPATSAKHLTHDPDVFTKVCMRQP